MWPAFFNRMPKPFDEAFLPEQDGHQVYYCQYGNPKGVPVLSFHGGPGGCSRPKYAKLFNAKKYRFIQFDQRGCGRSTATDILYRNETSYLLKDAQRLLEHLHITEPVIVHGCSWGATMALLFAETYPQQVSRLIVTSVFLARPYDAEWVSRDSERFYPDLWAQMRDKVRKNDIYPAYRKLLFSNKKQDNLKALTYLGSYEYMLGQLAPEFKTPEELDEADLKATRIAFHYEQNGYFLTPRQIIAAAAKIKHIPALIVHNRMDFCCPVKQAWDLHKALPASQLFIHPDYGHVSPKLHKKTKVLVEDFLG